MEGFSPGVDGTVENLVKVSLTFIELFTVQTLCGNK